MVYSSNESEEGKKTYYSCNEGKHAHLKYVLYDFLVDAVFVYQTEGDHDHENKESTEHSIIEKSKRESK